MLVTPAQVVADCATRLQQALGEPVTIARGFSEALTQLRISAFSLVILDHNLLEAEPCASDAMWPHLESATVLEVNLGLTGVDRLIEEVQSARKRFEHNRAAARVSAAHYLQSEVNETLTALLLDCDLATQEQDLPSAAGQRLAFIRAHVEKLREQLTLSCTN